MIITDKNLLSVAIPEDKLTASVFAFDEGAGEGAGANKESGVWVRSKLLPLRNFELHKRKGPTFLVDLIISIIIPVIL